MASTLITGWASREPQLAEDPTDCLTWADVHFSSDLIIAFVPPSIHFFRLVLHIMSQKEHKLSIPDPHVLNYGPD